MSWLFSRALVEEFSAVTCSDGEPSAQLNVMPTPHKFWRNDKTMEPSDHSRFGLTCAVLTADRGAALLMSFRAAFPVRTSASPAKVQELTGSDRACGHTWRGWSARFDRATSGWKTAQRSLLADSDEFSVIFPRSGMTRDGMLWELPTLGPRISEIASGLWPTPTVCGNYNKAGLSTKSGDGLATAVKTWPTPHGFSPDGKSNGPSGNELGRAVNQSLRYQTPVARMWKDNGASPGELARNSPTLAAQAGGSLNPTWVEWLMGWPLGWTDLKPLETDRFRQWRQQHSGA